MAKNEKEKKGILNAPPKTTFVMGLLVGIAGCAIIGVILSLTVLKPAANDKTADAGDLTNEADQAEESAVSPENISKYAAAINLENDTFNNCMSSYEKSEKVSADQEEGLEMGVNGTPATFINGYLIAGALPFSEFAAIIDEILAGKKPTSDYIDNDEPVDYQIKDGDNVRGNGTKLTFVEFSDFECPYSAYHAITMEQLYEAYKDQAKFVYKHFPLSFHQNAQIAAEAVECAADQEMFWEMHNKMFGLN